MRKLKLDDLWLVLDNLVKFRLEALRSLPMGESYEAQIINLHQRIQQTSSRSRVRPFSRELSDANEAHDNAARTIDFLLQTYESQSSRLSPEILKAINTARTHVLKTRKDLRASYADHALRARQRRKKIEEISPDLVAITVPGIGNLAELTEDYTSHGEKIDDLLHQRSLAEESSLDVANHLRLEVLAIFHDIQITLNLQQKNEKRLGIPVQSRITEDQIFGYAKTLLALRQSGDQTTKPNNQTTPDTPEDSPIAS